MSHMNMHACMGDHARQTILKCAWAFPPKHGVHVDKCYIHIMMCLKTIAFVL